MEEKLTDFLQAIDESATMKHYLESKQKVLENRSLCEAIETFHQTKDFALRKKIMEDADFMRYQHLENELYFMTLEISKRLKEVVMGVAR